MSKFIIQGGNPLNGEVSAVGNKNAVLKMIPATLLTSEPVILNNIPEISDVEAMIEMMKELGSIAEYDKGNSRLTLHTPEIKNTRINPEIAKKLRASNMFLGPVLARTGEVTSVMPGGDKIGPREMNAHFEGLGQLGANLTLNADGSFTIKGKLRGGEIFLYEPSVTATENTILASVTASGRTRIINAACEPHVQELCKMLNQMGAKISGIGSNILEIDGVEKLNGTTYSIPSDFIFIGTMIVLAAITKGEILIKNVNHFDMKTILYFFGKLGIVTEARGNDLFVPAEQKMIIEDRVWARSKGIYSQPWPCFPTDMMSLAIVLATQVKGTTLFFEKMYPGRMFFADYLNGIGANIIVADPHRVIVNGKTEFAAGGVLNSPDLRAGMAYVAAGLIANGTTTVTDVEHIYRGYPNIDKILNSLGASISVQ